MVIMMVAAQLYGVLQLWLLGWVAVTVRWRVLLAGFVAGLYGASVLSVSVQFAWTRGWAGLTGQSVYTVVRFASYTVDPFIEEIAKLLPVVVVWMLFSAARRQWSATDVVLVSMASGSGFGLAEDLLRYADRVGRATSDGNGGWMVHATLSGAETVPGPVRMLTSWLPAGVGVNDFWSLGASAGINVHLVFSAVAGLGLALALRAGQMRELGLPRAMLWVRLAGIGFIVLAGLDHASMNAEAYSAVPGWVTAPFTTARESSAFYPVVALVVVVGWDRWMLARSASNSTLFRSAPPAPDASPDAEPDAGPHPIAVQATSRTAAPDPAPTPTSLALLSLTPASLPWSWLVVTDFVRLRRALRFAGDDAPEELRAQVIGLASSLSAARGPQGPRFWAEVADGMRTRCSPTAVRDRFIALLRGQGPGGLRGTVLAVVWLVLMIPAVLYLVLSGLPLLGGLQDLFKLPVMFWWLVASAVLAALWTASSLVQGVRAVPDARKLPLADAAAGLGLQLVGRAGALVVTGVGLLAVLIGRRAGDPLIRNYHILDALGNLLLVAGLVLALLAVMADPPFALLALSTGGSELVWAGSMALLRQLVISGTLIDAGMMLSKASGSGRGSQGSSSGAGESGSSGGPPGARVPAPRSLKAFPKAVRARPKTPVQGGGGLRPRWKDPKGTIYEWDSQHGAVEKYASNGKHLGEFDPETGSQTKPADPTRKVEP